MPTGYTARLESLGYDVKRWLKESAIRAMGVCITLRDEGDLPESEIKARLARETEESYYSQQLRKAQDELARLLALSEEDWEREYTATLLEAQADYDRRVKEFEEKKRKHAQCTAEVSVMLQRAREQRQGEVVVNTLAFALEQLNQSYSFDYGGATYRQKILDQPLEAWRKDRVEELRRNINRYSQEKAKETGRTTDRLAEYEHFVTFVDNA